MLEEPDKDDVDEELDAIYTTSDCNAGSDEDSGDESGDTVNDLSGRHIQASPIRSRYKVWLGFE